MNAGRSRAAATGSSSLRVSLDQAIEIHAKALKYRFGHEAPFLARQWGEGCYASGDPEGHVVWERVAVEAEALLREGYPTSNLVAEDERLRR
jgi:hypothetical protein